MSPTSSRPCSSKSLAAGIIGLLLGCAAHQAPFQEGAWGDAPAPYPAEVVEITLEHQWCGHQLGCVRDNLVLRRDGRATHQVTAQDKDGSYLEHGEVDSTVFIQLVESLRQDSFFRSSNTGVRHEPLSSNSYILSAATFCRRAVRGFDFSDKSSRPRPSEIAAIEAAAGAIAWRKCCMARR